MTDALSLEIRSLPPLPQTVMELQQACVRPDITPNEVAQIIEKDPFMTADLLRAANSPLYGFAHRIDSVFNAVTRFGIFTTKGLAIASAVRSKFKIDLAPYQISLSQFTDTCNLKSAFLCHWYRGANELGVLVPATLLMYVGMAIIAEALRKNKREAQFMQGVKALDMPHLADLNDLETLEKQLIGGSHSAVLKELLEHWNFDTLLTRVIGALGDVDSPDNADLKKYTYPLNAVNMLISPYSAASANQLGLAKRFVRQKELGEAQFEATLKILKLDQKK